MIEKIKTKILASVKRSMEFLKTLEFLKRPRIRLEVITLLLLVLTITGFGMFKGIARATDVSPSSSKDLTKAYLTYCQGQSIGLIEDKDDVMSILESIRKEFESKFNMEAILLYDIEFKEIYTDDRYLSHMDKVETIIRENIKPQVKAKTLKIDGEETAILKSEDDIETIYQGLKEPYLAEAKEQGIEFIDIDFEEDIIAEDTYVDYETVEDALKVLDKLSKSQVEEGVYTVIEGDNVWSIAEQHEITVRELLDANAPMEESDILSIGQELKLNLPQFPINVITVEEEEYTQSIDFETEKKEDNSLLVGQTKVSQEGEKGEVKRIDKVYKRNGLETNRENISEEVIKEPLKQIVLVGTKKPVVSSRGTSVRSGGGGGGSLAWPTSGRISSPFGMRGGRMHRGMDIAAPKGTPVYAAAGGTVTYSGYNGSYGNLIKISHGNGMVTYYAHLSSRGVGQGTSVSRGQLIGRMGSTGRSTGSHLHFEVRIGGGARNPRNYLR